MQPFVMAEDLFQQLPDIVPVSVDFLLRDTLLILQDSADVKIPFSELLHSINTPECKSALVAYFSENENSLRRISVTEYFGLFFEGKTTIETFKHYTGIDESEMVSLNDIAVMILHDFMAEHLTKP
ncbi:hypothetical protein D3C85_1160660 [compost metagenome]